MENEFLKIIDTPIEIHGKNYIRLPGVEHLIRIETLERISADQSSDSKYYNLKMSGRRIPTMPLFHGTSNGLAESILSNPNIGLMSFASAESENMTLATTIDSYVKDFAGQGGLILTFFPEEAIEIAYFDDKAASRNDFGFEGKIREKNVRIAKIKDLKDKDLHLRPNNVLNLDLLSPKQSELVKSIYSDISPGQYITHMDLSNLGMIITT